jgi:putative membrane protein
VNLKLALVIITALILALSLISPPYPRNQLLQHGPTVVALALLAVAARKDWWTTGAFACIIAFLWLHILGARYIYSFVPYDQWASNLFGTSVSEWFGWQRNHYDRLVHFCFGILCMIPAFQLAVRSGKMTRAYAVVFALFATMTISACYEVFEWLLTMIVSPEDAAAYNGQQGDYWDAQKDMALVLSGAVLSIPIILMCSRKREKGSG